MLLMKLGKGEYESILICCIFRSAMSNRNCLLSQQLCHYLTQDRTLDNTLMRAAQR